MFYSSVTIDYIYLADGTKLSQKITNSSGITEKVQFGMLEYTNENKIQRVYNDVGSFELNYDNNTPEVFSDMNLHDHLGNVLITFRDKSKDGTVDNTDIVQEQHYYPFGMKVDGNWLRGNTMNDNIHQYNGKEFIEEIGLLDYGARFYDPSIARWTTIDPLAEVIPESNPYSYVFNNPMRFFDPDGRMGKPINFKRFTRKIKGFVGSLFKRNTSYSWKLGKQLINKNKKPRKKWRGIARYVEGQQYLIPARTKIERRSTIFINTPLKEDGTRDELTSSEYPFSNPSIMNSFHSNRLYPYLGSARSSITKLDRNDRNRYRLNGLHNGVYSPISRFNFKKYKNFRLSVLENNSNWRIQVNIISKYSVPYGTFRTIRPSWHYLYYGLK